MALIGKSAIKKRSEEAIVSIREWIINGDLKEGELVSELNLAEELKMSRTPVREALSYLCNEGLLDMIPGRGVIVAKMSLQDIEEILELRVTLEPLAALSAMHRIPEREIEHQIDLWIRAKMDAEKGIVIPSVNFAKWDAKLHGMFRQYCANERLKKILRVLDIQTRVFVIRSWETKAFVIETINQHLDILENIKKRDYEALKNSLIYHIKCNIKYHLGK